MKYILKYEDFIKEGFLDKIKEFGFIEDSKIKLTNVSYEIEEFLSEFLEYSWNKYNRNKNTYVDNIKLSVNSFKNIKNVNLNEEIQWFKDVGRWFEHDFFKYIVLLFKNAFIKSIKENKNFYNEVSILNETSFNNLEKIIDNELGFKKVKNFAYFLNDFYENFNKKNESKISENLMWFALNFEKYPNAPKAPNNFKASGYLIQQLILSSFYISTNINPSILNYKNGSIFVFKNIIQMIFMNLIPGLNLIFLILYIKHYFITLGKVLDKIEKAE